MSTVSLGKVQITPKGEYSVSAQYQALDCVSSGGNGYLAKKASVNVPVTNAEYWMLLAAKGADGETGNGIASITKTGTSGSVDTYTIAFTDDTATTFTVTNYAKPDTGIPKTDLAESVQDSLDQADSSVTRIDFSRGITSDASIWEFGAISSSNGGNSSTSHTRIRTNYLNRAVDTIAPAPGYKYMLFAYDSDNNDGYVGIWNGSSFKKTGVWLTEETSLYAIGRRNYRYRLVAANSGDATLDLAEDPQNIKFHEATDRSLLISGVPADAKEVGDRLSGKIIKTADNVKMYFRAANPNYWLEYQFVKINNPAKNASGWRICYVWLCNPDRSHVGYIAYTGEWEMAVRIDGRDDHIGLGNHGSEIQTMFQLYVDGKSIGEDDVFAERSFTEAQLICKLTMYDPSDSSAIVGYHTRIDTVNAVKKTVTIENKVDFVQNLTMKAGYLFMLPLTRINYEGTQVTDHFVDNQDYVITDCSTTEFSPSDSNHGVGERKSDTTEYKFWGSGFDLFGYAKLLRRVAPAGNTQVNHVTSDPTYNKIYMSVCADGETVSAGDTWLTAVEVGLDCGCSSL